MDVFMNVWKLFICAILVTSSSALMSMDEQPSKKSRTSSSSRSLADSLAGLIIQDQPIVDQEELNKRLLIIAHWNWPSRITELLNNGADINARDFPSHFTPLMTCAFIGNSEMCKFYLTQGADIHLHTNGRTALILAAEYKHEGTCKLLIDAMIQPTKQQIDSIVTLLGISKKRQSAHFNLIGRNIAKLIGCELLNLSKQLNKNDIQKQIKKAAQNQPFEQKLLDYLNSL
jgi:ankyrin repeat protein